MASRILVVEDDEKSRRLLTDVLCHQGYLVCAVTSGEEGLRDALECAPHAALLDIQLPGMTGFDVLAGLRRESGTAAIPVIAVTASVMDQDRKKILAAGFDAYVSKPVNIRDLLATLARLLTKAET